MLRNTDTSLQWCWVQHIFHGLGTRGQGQKHSRTNKLNRYFYLKLGRDKLYLVQWGLQTWESVCGIWFLQTSYWRSELVQLRVADEAVVENWHNDKTEPSVLFNKFLDQTVHHWCHWLHVLSQQIHHPTVSSETTGNLFSLRHASNLGIFWCLSHVLVSQDPTSGQACNKRL